jgi:DNA-binding phage protein
MLGSDQAIEAFLAEAMETSDAKLIASAIGVVARAKGHGQDCTRPGWLASIVTNP